MESANLRPADHWPLADQWPKLVALRHGLLLCLTPGANLVGRSPDGLLGLSSRSTFVLGQAKREEGMDGGVRW